MQAVAVVSADGIVTAKNAGTAVITASIGSDHLECEITIVSEADMDMLVLPAALKVIDDEAFKGISADYAIIPDGCTSIDEGAFAGSGLMYVYIPDSITDIAENAFSDCGDVFFFCESENAAAEYAKEAGILWCVK